MDIDYDKLKEEVREEVMESLKVDDEAQKKEDENTQAHITTTDFNNMNLTERINLKKEYPEAYSRLIK